MNSYYQQQNQPQPKYYERNSSPVHLAYENNNSCRKPKILPPFPEDNNSQKQNEDEFNDLREFRSKILEMDDEIQQLKRMEQEKHLRQHQHYDNHNNFIANNNNDNDSKIQRIPNKRQEQGNSTSELIEQQNSRIHQLQNQLENLKLQLSTNGHHQSTRRLNEDKFYSNDENRLPLSENRLNLEYDDEIQRRINRWTPKDPYQGPMSNLYFPFGSSGGGAPVRDKEGNLHTTLYGPKTLYRHPEEVKQKSVAAQIIQENMKQDMLQQKLRKLQDRQKIREPEGDLSEILQSFKVGRPRRDPNTGILTDNHLSSSDVTNIHYGTSPRSISPQRQNDNNAASERMAISHNDYGAELAKAAEEREMMKRLERLKEQQEVRQHNDAWDYVWGRSGGLVQRSNLLPAYTYPRYRSNHNNFYEVQYPNELRK